MPEKPDHKYFLRPMLNSDLALVLSWRNHPDIRRFMLNANEISMAEHEVWFNRMSIDPDRDILIYVHDGQDLGFVQFENMKETNIANWGFYLAPNSPAGLGTQLGVEALNYAFFTRGLQKVCGQALEFNESSIRFHSKLGFRKERVLRDYYVLKGVSYDLLCFELSGFEWCPSDWTERML